MRMTRLLLLLFFCLVPWVVCQGGQDEPVRNQFYNPIPEPPGETTPETKDFKNNPIYPIGSTQSLKWATNYTNPRLEFWQNDNPDSEILLSRPYGILQVCFEVG